MTNKNKVLNNNIIEHFILICQTQAVGLPFGGERMGTKEKENFCEQNQDTQIRKSDRSHVVL